MEVAMTENQLEVVAERAVVRRSHPDLVNNTDLTTSRLLRTCGEEGNGVLVQIGKQVGIYPYFTSPLSAQTWLFIVARSNVVMATIDKSIQKVCGT